MMFSPEPHDVSMSDDYKAAWNDVIKIEGNYENFARRRKKPEISHEQVGKVAKTDGRKSVLKTVNEEPKKDETSHEKESVTAAEKTEKRNTESKEEPINKRGKAEDNVKVAKIRFVERQRKKLTENNNNNKEDNSIDTTSKFSKEKLEDSSSRKIVKISMSSENSRKTMTSSTSKEDTDTEVSERDLLEKTRKILGEQSKKANLVKGQNVFLKKKTFPAAAAATSAGEAPQQLVRVSSRKSVSPKSLLSRNSVENNLSFELSVNSFSEPPTLEIPKFRSTRKRNKEETDIINNKQQNEHFSLYLGVCSQPLPVSIVTSLSARSTAVRSEGEKEKFPQSSIRRLPQINNRRDVNNSTDDVMVFKPRHRRMVGSPTLGEIALRRKLTDRLPTRKVQKRWPDAKSDFAFDLNIDRRSSSNNAEGISNREMSLKSKSSTFNLPFIRRKNSRRKLTQPPNNSPDSSGELKSHRKIITDYDVIGGESVTFRSWVFPEIEHKRMS